jgi:hypothetical protein
MLVADINGQASGGTIASIAGIFLKVNFTPENSKFQWHGRQ